MNQSINELSSIKRDLEQLLNNLPNLGTNWNDEVSVEYTKRVESIKEKKRQLLLEIQKLEELIKSSNNN